MPGNIDGIVNQEKLAEAIERLMRDLRPRYRRLWGYFKNPMRVCGDWASAAGSGMNRPYRQAQEWGLPARITGYCGGSEPFINGDRAGTRREVVIENDIGWRIDTLVDYLFGKPLVISSAAPDPARREVIGRILRSILAQNGGIGFLQQLALLGSVYGFVDVLVKLRTHARDASEPADCGAASLGEAPREQIDAREKDQPSLGGFRTPKTPVEAGPAPTSPPPSPAEGGRSAEAGGERRSPGADIGDDALPRRIARMIRLEIVEPARALPLLSAEDYTSLEAYGQVWETPAAADAGGSSPAAGAPAGRWWNRLRSALRRAGGPGAGPSESEQCAIEWITPAKWARLRDGRIVQRGVNSLGEIPLAHIQNAAAPFEYSGAGDVEPLIPLQDELNTRLSDRANRITLQSFKMYLGKGIESFNDRPVAPGRMWMTENEKAQIQEFGGDANCPSEESHISDLREALDKASGVTPIAAGAIKNRIGRLTSAAALRITLLALLSKTDKKRTSYGAGIERICELALKWLDISGLFPNTPEERRIEINWPSPLPENELEKLQEADLKLRLGIDRAVVLRELGY